MIFWYSGSWFSQHDVSLAMSPSTMSPTSDIQGTYLALDYSNDFEPASVGFDLVIWYVHLILQEMLIRLLTKSYAANNNCPLLR